MVADDAAGEGSPGVLSLVPVMSSRLNESTSIGGRPLSVFVELSAEEGIVLVVEAGPPVAIEAKVLWKGFLMMGTSTAAALPVAEFRLVLFRSSSFADDSSSLSLRPNAS